MNRCTSGFLTRLWNLIFCRHHFGEKQQNRTTCGVLANFYLLPFSSSLLNKRKMAASGDVRVHSSNTNEDEEFLSSASVEQMGYSFLRPCDPDFQPQGKLKYVGSQQVPPGNYVGEKKGLILFFSWIDFLPSTLTLMILFILLFIRFPVRFPFFTPLCFRFSFLCFWFFLQVFLFDFLFLICFLCFVFCFLWSAAQPPPPPASQGLSISRFARLLSSGCSFFTFFEHCLNILFDVVCAVWVAWLCLAVCLNIFEIETKGEGKERETARKGKASCLVVPLVCFLFCSVPFLYSFFLSVCLFISSVCLSLCLLFQSFWHVYLISLLVWYFFLCHFDSFVTSTTLPIFRNFCFVCICLETKVKIKEKGHWSWWEKQWVSFCPFCFLLLLSNCLPSCLSVSFLDSFAVWILSSDFVDFFCLVLVFSSAAQPPPAGLLFSSLLILPFCLRFTFFSCLCSSCFGFFWFVFFLHCLFAIDLAAASAVPPFTLSAALASSSSSSSSVDQETIQGSFALSQHLFIRRGLCATLRQRLEEDARQAKMPVREILATFQGQFAQSQSEIVNLINENSNLCEDIFLDLNFAVHSGLDCSLLLLISLFVIWNLSGFFQPRYLLLDIFFFLKILIVPSSKFLLVILFDMVRLWHW